MATISFLLPANRPKFYFGGDVVHGWVVVKVTSPVQTRSICVEFSGQESVYIEKISARVGHVNGVPMLLPKVKKFRAHKVIIPLTRQRLLGVNWSSKSSGVQQQLAVGEHKFAFAFSLPECVPPTALAVNNEDATSIQYTLKAMMDVPAALRFDKVAKFSVPVGGFTLSEPARLRLMSPSAAQSAANAKTFTLQPGKLTLRVRMAQGAYYPGDTMQVTVRVDNQSRQFVDQILVNLLTVFNVCAQGESETNDQTQLMTKYTVNITPSSVSAATSNFNQQFDVVLPPNTVPSVDSTLIEVQHRVQIEANVASVFQANLKSSVPLTVLLRRPFPVAPRPGPGTQAAAAANPPATNPAAIGGGAPAVAKPVAARVVASTKKYVQDMPRADNEKYSGEVDNQDRPDGRGEIEYPNGDLFRGKFARGKRGDGKYFFSDVSASYDHYISCCLGTGDVDDCDTATAVTADADAPTLDSIYGSPDTNAALPPAVAALLKSDHNYLAWPPSYATEELTGVDPAEDHCHSYWLDCLLRWAAHLATQKDARTTLSTARLYWGNVVAAWDYFLSPERAEKGSLRFVEAITSQIGVLTVMENFTPPETMLKWCRVLLEHLDEKPGDHHGVAEAVTASAEFMCGYWDSSNTRCIKLLKAYPMAACARGSPAALVRMLAITYRTAFMAWQLDRDSRTQLEAQALELVPPRSLHHALFLLRVCRTLVSSHKAKSPQVQNLQQAMQHLDTVDSILNTELAGDIAQCEQFGYHPVACLARSQRTVCLLKLKSLSQEEASRALYECMQAARLLGLQAVIEGCCTLSAPADGGAHAVPVILHCAQASAVMGRVATEYSMLQVLSFICLEWTSPPLELLQWLDRIVDIAEFTKYQGDSREVLHLYEKGKASVVLATANNWTDRRKYQHLVFYDQAISACVSVFQSGKVEEDADMDRGAPVTKSMLNIIQAMCNALLEQAPNCHRTLSLFLELLKVTQIPPQPGGQGGWDWLSVLPTFQIHLLSLIGRFHMGVGQLTEASKWFANSLRSGRCILVDEAEPETPDTPEADQEAVVAVEVDANTTFATAEAGAVEVGAEIQTGDGALSPSASPAPVSPSAPPASLAPAAAAVSAAAAAGAQRDVLAMSLAELLGSAAGLLDQNTADVALQRRQDVVRVGLWTQIHSAACAAKLQDHDLAIGIYCGICQNCAFVLQKSWHEDKYNVPANGESISKAPLDMARNVWNVLGQAYFNLGIQRQIKGALDVTPEVVAMGVNALNASVVIAKALGLTAAATTRATQVTSAEKTLSQTRDKAALKPSLRKPPPQPATPIPAPNTATAKPPASAGPSPSAPPAPAGLLAQPVPQQPAGQAPVVQWEADNAALCCRCCQQEFGFFRRRHHCRHCGKLVCDACSPSVIVLSLGPVPVRVCTLCRKAGVV